VVFSKQSYQKSLRLLWMSTMNVYTQKGHKRRVRDIDCVDASSDLE
jgi:hypothetical protein